MDTHTHINNALAKNTGILHLSDFVLMSAIHLVITFWHIKTKQYTQNATIQGQGLTDLRRRENVVPDRKLFSHFLNTKGMKLVEFPGLYVLLLFWP